MSAGARGQKRMISGKELLSGSPRAGITGGCKRPDMRLGTKLLSSAKQYMLFKPSADSPVQYFWNRKSN